MEVKENFTFHHENLHYLCNKPWPIFRLPCEISEITIFLLCLWCISFLHILHFSLHRNLHLSYKKIIIDELN